MYRFSTILTLLIVFMSINASIVHADVVKPALIEVSVYTTGGVDIEIRASIEALLTGINALYKNTQDAPTADAYDALRVLEGNQLEGKFETFHRKILDQIFLEADGKKVNLSISSVTVPEPGYTKVPRISIIRLTATIDKKSKHIRWYYPASFGDNAVRVRQVDETNQKWHWSQWQWLRNDEASQQFSLTEVFTKAPLMETIWSYLVVGFEHIVPKGTDHILFIFGLFLFSVKIKPLLWQVTMFTIAHTMTLGLSMNGVIALPSVIVEPLIALSIAYVGIENVFAKQLHKSRLLLVFAFGLLHGLGFASVLEDFGMPEDDFITALISFNIGVEFGQLAVISLAFLMFGLWFQHRVWYRKRIVIPASIGISIIGLFWTIERLSIIN